GLFGPFSVLPYLRPVATGCARLAPQTLHGSPEFGGLLVDGLRAVAGEQPHGRLVGQFRGGDVGGGSEGEAGFLDGHVDEVWQSGPLARDARVEEPAARTARRSWGRPRWWRRGTGCSSRSRRRPARRWAAGGR